MIDIELKKKMYFEMLRIRMIEEAIAERYHEQEMRCPVHLCIGQEAIAVGVCANLSKEDHVMSNHRSHGHYLAKGGDLKAMLAEIYGKETGCSYGKGGSMHLVDLSVNFTGATPIVGGSIPVAVGLAFGTALKDKKYITAVFFGDAATEEGVFSESLNFASLKKLPVVFVCENNFYSVYSPLSVRQPPERNNVSIAKAYGVAGETGDGNDVLDVYERTERAINHIKQGLGPYYLQFDTYRWREHCGPNYDNNLGYRTEDEFNFWQNRCPIKYFEKSLINEGILEGSELEKMARRVREEIEEAFEFAKKSPFPDPESLFSGVYA